METAQWRGEHRLLCGQLRRLRRIRIETEQAFHIFAKLFRVDPLLWCILDRPRPQCFQTRLFRESRLSYKTLEKPVKRGSLEQILGEMRMEQPETPHPFQIRIIPGQDSAKRR